MTSKDYTALWLHNKLGSSTQLWSFSSTVVSQYSLEKLQSIRDCFVTLDSLVKIKFFMSLFYIPKRQFEEVNTWKLNWFVNWNWFFKIYTQIRIVILFKFLGVNRNRPKFLNELLIHVIFSGVQILLGSYFIGVPELLYFGAQNVAYKAIFFCCGPKLGAVVIKNRTNNSYAFI